MMDKIIRSVSRWLAVMAAILVVALAAVLWWGGGADGHIRRLIYSPGDNLFAVELMRINALSETARRAFGQKLAILLPQWCPDQCGDWVQSDHDAARLLWIIESTAYTHDGICPQARRIADNYLKASEQVAKRALAVWGVCGQVAEYQNLSVLSYPSQTLETSRQEALDAMMRNLSHDDVMGVLNTRQ